MHSPEVNVAKACGHMCEKWVGICCFCLWPTQGVDHISDPNAINEANSYPLATKRAWLMCRVCLHRFNLTHPRV